MPDTIKEPSSEQCAERATWSLPTGDMAMACWYPQMGGYVGKAVVVTHAGENCFDVYVWHDGEFPFGDGSNPAELHHCSADQFRTFAESVEKLQGEPT